MPYINTKLNVGLSKEKEKAIKEKLGNAIAILPGKSENWLMLGFEDGCRLYFKGDDSAPMAYVEVSVYGNSNASAYNKLTAAITQILNEELSVKPDHVYVKYMESEHWGFNGSNF